MMNEEVLFSQLTELADKLGISVREENFNLEEATGAGGLCRVEGKYILLLNSRAAVQEKNQVAVRALRQFDLSNIYLKPFIRELLEGQEE